MFVTGKKLPDEKTRTSWERIYNPCRLWRHTLPTATKGAGNVAVGTAVGRRPDQPRQARRAGRCVRTKMVACQRREASAGCRSVSAEHDSSRPKGVWRLRGHLAKFVLRETETGFARRGVAGRDPAVVDLYTSPETDSVAWLMGCLWMDGLSFLLKTAGPDAWHP